MNRLMILAGIGSLALSHAALAQEATYALRPFYADPPDPEEVSASIDRLPRGVSAAPPALDGALFVARVEADIYPVRGTEDVLSALAEILPALGVELDVGDLEISEEGVEKPMADLDALSLEAELRVLSWRVQVERTAGPLSQDSIDLMTEEALELYEEAATPVQIWRFQQVVDRARVEARTVTVEVDDTGIRRIMGALYNNTRTSNEVEIDAERAAAIALAHASELRASVPEAPELVALPEGGGLVFAWRLVLETERGPYGMAIDAQSGEVVEVDPQFYSITGGAGRVAIPGLPATFSKAGFDVDDAAGCGHTFQHADVIAFSNYGGDGYTDEVSACLDVYGEADFDVAPIADTTNVMKVTAADYNPQFAHVNAYAWTFDALDYFISRGSGDLPEWTLIVSDNNPCGFGIDNACGKRGSLALGIGSKTFGSSMGLFNTALDASVILHEVGHGINNNRYAAGGGIQNGSCAEGISDYWAMSRLDSNIVGVVTTGTISDTEGGGLPRAADAADVFPEHLYLSDVNNESHANGQVIARALWASRLEMDSRSPIGPMVIDELLMAAMPAAGTGQSKSTMDLAVHNAFQGILVSMITEAGYGLTSSDILVGFARAGLLATENEAVIDISKDIIDANQISPPSFRVWTGRDFGFTSNYVNAEVSYNTNYEIEVASDIDFTMDLFASGPKSDVTISDGVATATWTLSQDAWNKLRKGKQMYFRVITWADDGSWESVRSSDHFYGELFDVMPARAIINQSNEGRSCSAARGRVSGLVGLLGALAAMIRRLILVPLPAGRAGHVDALQNHGEGGGVDGDLCLPRSLPRRPSRHALRRRRSRAAAGKARRARRGLRSGGCSHGCLSSLHRSRFSARPAPGAQAGPPRRSAPVHESSGRSSPRSCRLRLSRTRS